MPQKQWESKASKTEETMCLIMRGVGLTRFLETGGVRYPENILDSTRPTSLEVP